jgi:hypothetical protein
MTAGAQATLFDDQEPGGNAGSQAAPRGQLAGRLTDSDNSPAVWRVLSPRTRGTN